MRISDWSSDVCSSDLLEKKHSISLPSYSNDRTGRQDADKNLPKRGIRRIAKIEKGIIVVFNDGHIWLERKSVVLGKSVSVRVDLGGIRIIKKINAKQQTQMTLSKL